MTALEDIFKTTKDTLEEMWIDIRVALYIRDLTMDETKFIQDICTYAEIKDEFHVSVM